VNDDDVGAVFTHRARGVVRRYRFGDDDIACFVEQEPNQATFERTPVCNDGARPHDLSLHASLQRRPRACIAHDGHAHSYPTGLVLSADSRSATQERAVARQRTAIPPQACGSEGTGPVGEYYGGVRRCYEEKEVSMRTALLSLISRIDLRREEGAIGWLILGVIIGAILIIILIVQLLIPGDGD
jgi:hypothetical protein